MAGIRQCRASDCRIAVCWELEGVLQLGQTMHEVMVLVTDFQERMWVVCESTLQSVCGFVRGLHLGWFVGSQADARSACQV